MERNNMITKELIIPSCRLLKNQKIQEHNFEKPKYPTCIFYLGDNSVGYQKEMNNDLIRGWGKAASYIQHIFVKSADDLENSLYDENDNTLSIEMLKKKITDMMSYSQIFSDMNFLNVYFILETTGVTADEFEKWYSILEELEKEFLISIRSCLMIILNQSLDISEESKLLRQKLYDIYKSNEYSEENSHIYDSVFLFSNRLRNGQFININCDSPEYMDYNLYADIILLLNTNDSDLNNRRSNLYNRTVPAFTAAYRNLSKPTQDIVMITLKKMLVLIRNSIEDINNDLTVNDNIISEILGVKNGSLPIIEKFYHEVIESSFNVEEALKYLPSEESVFNLSFEQADGVTQGCLRLFYNNIINNLIKEKVEQCKNEIKLQLKSEINKKMNVKQHQALRLYNGNIESVIKSLLHYNIDLLHNERVKDTIFILLKNNLVLQFIPIITEVILDLQKAERESINIFSELYHDINLMSTESGGGLRQNLENFYENIVETYFINDKIKDLTKKILSECNTKEDMILVLNNQLKSIFTNNSVYKLSFVDELVKRVVALGKNIDIGNLITSELTNDLGYNIALHSLNSYSNRFFEAYFLNTQSDDNKKNILLSSLKKQENTVMKTYYNTLNNDMVESIWFYKCSEDNIQI